MRSAIGAFPLLASVVLASIPVTLASFNATTSSPSNAFTNLVVQPATLSAPLTAAAGLVQLSWTASPTPGATYGVMRSPSGAGVWTQVVTTSALSYNDTPPSDGSWDYVVRALVASFSSDSGVRTGLSDRTPPTTPTGVTAITGLSAGTAVVGWNASTDAGSGLAGYTVYYVQANTCPAASKASYPSRLSTTAQALTVAGLTSGKRYCFFVTATDVAGNESAPSGVARANAR